MAGGYNNITNTNKVSPTQNTPALQAKNEMIATFATEVKWWTNQKWRSESFVPTGIEQVMH